MRGTRVLLVATLAAAVGGAARDATLAVDTTSTSTTTTTGDTTTTSTLQADCAEVPAGPTFASLNCRLAALIAQVAASPELGASQSRISKALAKAKLRKEGAETKCSAAKLLSVKGQLAKAVLRLVGVKTALGQPAARREIPAALRDELTATLNGLQADLRTLRKSVRCPDDAAV
jgi:hypothetical protein